MKVLQTVTIILGMIVAISKAGVETTYSQMKFKSSLDCTMQLVYLNENQAIIRRFSNLFGDSDHLYHYDLVEAKHAHEPDNAYESGDEITKFLLKNIKKILIKENEIIVISANESRRISSDSDKSTCVVCPTPESSPIHGIDLFFSSVITRKYLEAAERTKPTTSVDPTNPLKAK